MFCSCIPGILPDYNCICPKEISSTQQVVQANDLLKKLQNVQEDLKDVPPVAKYKNIAHEVTKAVNSLSQKIDAAKTRWLKIV